MDIVVGDMGDIKLEDMGVTTVWEDMEVTAVGEHMEVTAVEEDMGVTVVEDFSATLEDHRYLGLTSMEGTQVVD